MLATVNGIFCVAIFVVIVNCETLHPIESKPGLCFKIHTADQPIFQPNPRKPIYTNLYESCTECLKDSPNCLGLRTQNDEVLVLYCKGVKTRNRPGCYKMINKDKREEIVCQKLAKQQSCEVITTRTNLNIVAYCYNRALSTLPNLRAVDVKRQKPKRE